MPTISITDLKPTGSDLFQDSETYLRDISADEEIGISGGTLTSTVPCGVAISISVITYIVTRKIQEEGEKEIE